MVTRAQRILEELIYDRVRSNVNLCQLIVIEQELDDSIQRALLGPGDGVSAASVTAAASFGAGFDTNAHRLLDDVESMHESSTELAQACLERAWRRLEHDWQRLRIELGCTVAPMVQAAGDDETDAVSSARATAEPGDVAGPA